MAEYSYTDDRNYYLETLDYGNGDSIQYEYDDMGRVTKQTYEDGETVSYQYDNNGALATVTDSETGIKTTYYYDFTDRMMKYVESGDGYSHCVGYEYDQLNNLTSIVDTINGVKRTTSYSYDEDNRIESVITGNSSTSYSYDGFGRVSQEQTKDGENVVLTDSYTFHNPTPTTTSTQVATHTVASSGFNATYSYTYDDNGNILSVSDGTYTTSYAYDSANQLIRENNQKANKTWTWDYDNAGNILGKKEYTYTTGTLGTPTDTIDYAYGNDNWGDLLTSYDGKAITYDGVGNMLTYGYNTYSWKHGRQLDSMTYYSNSWEFTYNADGLRTSRSSDDYDASFQYYYSGDKLVRLEFWEDWSPVVDGYMEFTYDSNGVPISANYDMKLYSYYDEEGNETDYYTLIGSYTGTFYYITNLQGDVIALVDEDGDLLVEYTYDAWGNLLNEQRYINPLYIFHYNPLRYRGYVYDYETGLYYLQSRYYDPEIGRFINADGLVSTGQGFSGNNMFAYCGNNPVNRADITGCGWIAIIAGAIVSVAISWIASAVTGQDFTWSDVGVAAITGALGAFGKWGIAANSLINGVFSANEAYEGGASWGGIVGSGITSALFNAICFGELSNAGDDLAGVAISGFIDFVFGTGYTTMDEAISKTLIENTSKNKIQKNTFSAIDVVMRSRQISRTRIYNGQVITIGSGKRSRPGPRSDPNKLYCYVEL